MNENLHVRSSELVTEIAQAWFGKVYLDASFQNPPLGGFKHVECLCGTPGIVSLLKTWFFQLCMIASTLFWSNSMDTFNGLIVLRIHF